MQLYRHNSRRQHRVSRDIESAIRRLKKGLDRRRFAAVYNFLVIQLMSYEQLTPEHLDATFAALADPTRRAILARLASGEASVAELAGPFAMTQPAISKHLKVLERAGLISRGHDAQRRPRRLEAKPLAEANEWLEGYRRFWESSFQRLDALLSELKTEERKAEELKTQEKQTQQKKPGRTKR
jgi:DNA-binding transcriptional ArsR family regulator